MLKIHFQFMCLKAKLLFFSVHLREDEMNEATESLYHLLFSKRSSFLYYLKIYYKLKKFHFKIL